MRNTNIVLINAANAASNQTSSAVDANQMYSVSVQASCTGTPSGTIALQASNDVPNNERTLFTPLNWTAIPNATATVTSGASAIVTVPNLNYGYIRAVWTTSSGTGTVTVTMNAQGI